MAILRIDEDMDTRSMTWKLGEGRSYTRRFAVQTDSQSDGPRVVMLGIAARLGDRYACGYNNNEQDNAYALSWTVSAAGHAGIDWVVDVEYGFINPNLQGGADENPLLVPIDVKWGFRDYEDILDFDIQGNPVLNTAGDRFEPPATLDNPRQLLTIVRNEATFDAGIVKQYRKAINNDTFAGNDPYFCQVLNISAENPYDQNIGWYYKVTYEFEIMCAVINHTTEGFRKKIISQGTRALSAVTGQLYQCALHGVPVSNPILLDKNGYWINVPQPVPYTIDTAAYPKLPFAAFKFDQDAISGLRTGLDYIAKAPQ